MSTHLRRSATAPIRNVHSWADRWEGADKGLILCWESGRRMRVHDPALAVRAKNGELVELPWKGGIQKKVRSKVAYGTRKYLAMWQGLRGDDLDIEVDLERMVVCTKTGQAVLFRGGLQSNQRKEGVKEVTVPAKRRARIGAKKTQQKGQQRRSRNAA